MIFMLMEPLPERREGGHPQKTMTTQWREAILGIKMDGGQNHHCLMWTLVLKLDQSMLGLGIVKIIAKLALCQRTHALPWKNLVICIVAVVTCWVRLVLTLAIYKLNQKPEIMSRRIPIPTMRRTLKMRVPSRSRYGRCLWQWWCRCLRSTAYLNSSFGMYSGPFDPLF